MQCADTGSDVPCEVSSCPYSPSPGREGALDPANWRAMWLWERLQTIGPAVWDLVPWEMTEAEAALLIEQMHTLITYSAYLGALTRHSGDG